MALLKNRIIDPDTRSCFFKLFMLLLLIVPVRLSGQTKGSIEDYLQLNRLPPKEKVYLHLDRPNYVQGDTIWFKAYSWFGYEQIPDTISGVLYIDLLNQDGRIKLKRKVLIQNGISQGDFSLDTTISPGRYTLRAYTRWMQNLNTGEPFYQTVTISPANQNFQVECTPVIIKTAGKDSLKVSFRFFEMDQAGELKNSFSHKVDYTLKIGDRLLDSSQVLTINTKEQFFKCSLSGLDENEMEAVVKLSVRDNRITFEKQFRIPLQENIDLQFFPEGGNLVTGITSKVGFKAIGTDGLSREVSGNIETENEVVVANFRSTNKGMGYFLLKPEPGEKYFAHLLYNNRNYLIPLPQSSENGCTMSVRYPGGSNDPYLTIKCSPSETNTQKYITGSANGGIRFSAPVKMINDSCWLRIPLALLPEGICRLTVLNDDFQPESERIIYIDKNKRFKIEVTPDSASWSTRSKATLNIKTTGIDGAPVQADLSLAVVDKDQIVNNAEVNGICSYKLLKSEIHGNIEDVDLYFKNDSGINRSILDLLLLTQGFRKFLPGKTDSGEQKFQPERSFDISGKIRLNGSESQDKKFDYSSVDLTLLCRSAVIYIDQSRPDALGRFLFKTPLLYGKSPSVIQATNSKGKPLYGEIFINDTVARPGFKKPLPLSLEIASPSIENVRRLQNLKKAESSKTPLYGEMFVNLGEVKVTAKAKNWYRDYEKEAIKIADLDELDPTGKKYENVYQLLVREFGAKLITLEGTNLKTIILPCASTGPDLWYPIYLINGKTYFKGLERGEMFVALLNALSFMKVNEISKIMVLPPGNIPSYYADDSLKTAIRQSLVVIETYSDNSFRGDPRGIKTFILDGLDAPRIFFSPRYEGATGNNPVYDGRATLFWDPSVRTDASGQAKIEFFTSDRRADLEVVINGTEGGTGNPGQKQLLIKY